MLLLTLVAYVTRWEMIEAWGATLEARREATGRGPLLAEEIVDVGWSGALKWGTAGI